MQGWHPGADHSVTLDGRIYDYVKAHGGRAPDVDEGLAQRTHDHYIDVALADYLMRTGPAGGRDHGRLDHPRGRPQLPARRPPDGRARTARLPGRRRRRPRHHGGREPRRLPGGRPDAERERAVDELAAAPPWPEDPAGYMRASRTTCRRDASLPAARAWPIPTWVTAGEPISLFASHIAKYFSNSIREDGLLAVATAGIVFAPGGAGTMQEIFQDGAQNAYRVFGRSPMAFLDSGHYCAETGLYPALQRQAARLGFADLLSVGDEPEEILERFPAAATAPRVDGSAGDARQAHAQRALKRAPERQSVWMSPPSITKSAPVTLPARSPLSISTRSATCFGCREAPRRRARHGLARARPPARRPPCPRSCRPRRPTRARARSSTGPGLTC